MPLNEDFVFHFFFVSVIFLLSTPNQFSLFFDFLLFCLLNCTLLAERSFFNCFLKRKNLFTSNIVTKSFKTLFFFFCFLQGSKKDKKLLNEPFSFCLSKTDLRLRFGSRNEKKKEHRIKKRNGNNCVVIQVILLLTFFSF